MSRADKALDEHGPENGKVDTLRPRAEGGDVYSEATQIREVDDQLLNEMRAQRGGDASSGIQKTSNAPAASSVSPARPIPIARSTAPQPQAQPREVVDSPPPLARTGGVLAIIVWIAALALIGAEVVYYLKNR